MDTHSAMIEQATISRVTIRTAPPREHRPCRVLPPDWCSRKCERAKSSAVLGQVSGAGSGGKASVRAESHPDSEGPLTRLASRSNEASEPHNQAGRGPGEIDPPPPVDDVDQIQRAERAEV